MKKQRYEYVTMALALLAFVALMPMKSWAVDISAPQTSATVHLGVNDPPASATLNGWYCSDTDLRVTVGNALVEIKRGGTGMEWREAAFEMMNRIEKGWPHNTMERNPVKVGLDAPPGGSKVYNFKCCYTKSELDALAKRLDYVFLRLGEEEMDVFEGSPGYAEVDEVEKWIR